VPCTNTKSHLSLLALGILLFSAPMGAPTLAVNLLYWTSHKVPDESQDESPPVSYPICLDLHFLAPHPSLPPWSPASTSLTVPKYLPCHQFHVDLWPMLNLLLFQNESAPATDTAGYSTQSILSTTFLGHSQTLSSLYLMSSFHSTQFRLVVCSEPYRRFDLHPSWVPGTGMLSAYGNAWA